MNQNDRKEFDVIHSKIDNIQKDIAELKLTMDKAHGKTDESLKFIKENLFDPHKGLWAETKQNSTFRESANKWRTTIGAGFVGLLFKQIYDILK